MKNYANQWTSRNIKYFLIIHLLPSFVVIIYLKLSIFYLLVGGFDCHRSFDYQCSQDLRLVRQACIAPLRNIIQDYLNFITIDILGQILLCCGVAL